VVFCSYKLCLHEISVLHVGPFNKDMFSAYVVIFKIDREASFFLLNLNFRSFRICVEIVIFDIFSHNGYFKILNFRDATYFPIS